MSIAVEALTIIGAVGTCVLLGGLLKSETGRAFLAALTFAAIAFLACTAVLPAPSSLEPGLRFLVAAGLSTVAVWVGLQGLVLASPSGSFWTETLLDWLLWPTAWLRNRMPW